MKIDCLGTVGIVHTKQKPYWYKRKGFYVGERYVKAKKIRKYKTVPLKEPYLSGYIQLEVDEKLILGGIYADENGKKYCCVSFHNFTAPLSTLTIVTTDLGKTFAAPKKLVHIMSAAFESSTGSTDR